MAKSQSEYKAIAAQFAAAKRKAETKASEDGAALSGAVVFKTQHLLAVVFLSWIFLLHVIGIYFFTKGFLLTRLVLDHKSQCSQPPIRVEDHGDCWLPHQFDKAVVIIIDALRYDFTVPQDSRHHYHNALGVLHQTAVESPTNALLLPFISDPPTTTLQRLKGLTTGTLPTFIDAGSNFDGTAIDEDNLIAQLVKANKTIVHLGDDTWHSLFPGYFEPNLTKPYDSFNVWDLHTVDNGVTEHLFPLLDRREAWDVLIGHYLGVDHAGHRYGPDHPAMTAKLQQMDTVLRKVMESVDEKTLLVVFGDHGMDSKGDHGGESDDEVEAALWMYSKKPIFGRADPSELPPPATAKSRAIGQIDLVPTLALLLGLPIPFNNLGAPIKEAFIGNEGTRWDALASAYALTAAQIHNYQVEYSALRGLDTENGEMPKSGELWSAASDLWSKSRSSKISSEYYRNAYESLSAYQAENLRVCKDLWARFNVPSMATGISILLLAIVILIMFVRLPIDSVSTSVPKLLRNIGFGAIVGTTLGGLALSTLLEVSTLDASLLAGAFSSIAVHVSSAFSIPTLQHFLPRSLWTWIAILFTVLQSVGFASNSYTIWEDEILLFFCSTFAALSLISSMRHKDHTSRVLGLYHSFSFLFLTRAASFSRLCREEQMPFCRSTYYASSTSSTSAVWQLVIPYLVAIMLPLVIKGYYQGTKSYQGSAVFWVGVIFRLGLLASAIFWTLDAADDAGWLAISHEKTKTIKVMISQTILGVAFGVGITNFYWAEPCVNISTGDPQPPKSSKPAPKQVIILGYSNVHGSRYALLFGAWLLGIILLQKPMGNGALALMAWQMFSLLEIVDTNSLSESAVAPVVLGLLGNYYFFKTGHQATLTSIQWDSAFIALKTIRYPWSPLLVTLNSFGSQILAAIFVPLTVLWKQAPKKPALLGGVTRALAVHFLYYAFINVATTIWAGHLRRHLMLYRIFCPRFMTGAGVLLVVDIIGIFIALGGFRWNMLSIADIFGWA